MKHPFCSENEKIAEVLHIHGGASILHISLDLAETPEVLHIHGAETLQLEAPANPPKISEMHEIPMKSIKMACRLVIPGASTLGTFLSKFGRGPEVLHRHGGASILHISLDLAEIAEVLHRQGASYLVWKIQCGNNGEPGILCAG